MLEYFTLLKFQNVQEMFSEISYKHSVNRIRSVYLFTKTQPLRYLEKREVYTQFRKYNGSSIVAIYIGA